MKRSPVLTLLFSAIVCGSATAQSVDQYERILASAYSPDAPGATAIVARGGDVLFLGAAGLANVELGIPLEPDMVFEIGSITKQFTAAAIMMLAEDGKLSIEDPLSTFFPDYPNGNAVTVEHLLTHTSGIVSYTGIRGYMGTKVRLDMAVDEIIDVFKDLPYEFSPGDRWAYNNSGYILLGAIIEHVSGESYEAFVEGRIFDRLGMESARYGDRGEIIPRRASGYVGGPDSYGNAPFLSMTQPYAAGSLMMNVQDLVRWNRALYGGDILSLASVERMTTPFVLNDGDTTTYGFGLGVGEVRERHTIRHGGGIFGYVTDALYIPEDDLIVAVFSNSASAGVQGLTVTRLAALALDEPYPVFNEVAVDPAILQRYEGVYKIDDDTERSVWVEDVSLYTQRTHSRRLQASPFSETQFFFARTLSHFEFVIEHGVVVAMLMYQDGATEPERAERISDVPARRQPVSVSAATLDRYVGVYKIGTDMDLTISREGETLSAGPTGQESFLLQATSETAFFNSDVGFDMEFVLENGEVVAATVRLGAREIRAERRPR